MNYGLIPVSVCKTPYRESENLEGRQLLVAAFFLFFFYSLVLFHGLLF